MEHASIAIPACSIAIPSMQQTARRPATITAICAEMANSVSDAHSDPNRFHCESGDISRRWGYPTSDVMHQMHAMHANV